MNNKISGTFPLGACETLYGAYCYTKSGNDLVAPCGRTKACCDLDIVADCQTPKQYTLIKSDAECNSGDAWLGKFDTVKGCADECAQTEGCRFFIYGKEEISGRSDGDKTGQCYHEKTSDAKCSEGWESDSYDFYEVLQDSSSSSKSSSGGKDGSLAIIVPVVVAAVLLVAAVLFLVRKRAVAARQPHRDASMPNVGDEAEAEA